MSRIYFFLFSLCLSSTALFSIERNAKPPQPARIELKHIESNGIGYNQGYTSLDGFFASLAKLDANWVPFLDLRAHIFNDGFPDLNVGIGARYLRSRTWGANVYYDYRKTSHYHYNQVGAGLETLGKIWDFRLNGYFPAGKKARSYDFKFHEFEGHHMILSNKKEFAMIGGNAEVGAHAYHRDRDNMDIYAAMGPYYFYGQGQAAWGGEGRIRMTAFDHVGFQLSGSYDTVFKGIVQGEVSLFFSWGGEKKTGKKSSRAEGYQSPLIVKRALQNVDRQEIVVVDRKKEKSVAIDPATGKPYTFLFVDNTSHSQGTFESPFNTLLAAEQASNANDIIYVFAGDGTDNGMNSGITLQYGQQLLGAGIAQKISTTRGTITVPAQGSGYPIISNFNDPTGLGVQLVNGNNVLSGLYLKDRLGITEGSLFSSAVTIQNGSNYLIQNNLLGSFSTGSCISIYGPGDNTSIVNNTFICTDRLNACTGIFFYDILTPVTGTFNIANNLFKGANDTSGFNDSIGTFGPGAPLGINSKVSVNISSNTFVSQSNNGTQPTAIDFTADNATLSITGNYIDISELTGALAGVYLEQDSTAKLFTASLSDNVCYSASGVPGYDFKNTTGISSVMIIEFGSNVGISVGP